MDTFEINGGNKLNGTLVPQGAKNEALQVICAVLLTCEEVIIKNIPDIRDVNILIGLLKELGVKVNNTAHEEYSFKADNINFDYLHTKEFIKNARSIRGSIMIVGPLLARYNKAVCTDCITNNDVVDVNDNKITFGNIDEHGGFISYTTLKNGEEIVGKEHTCYINGYECYADETRFGGIVISCFMNTNKRQKIQ